jgi:serine/threonine protein kinase
MEKEKFIITSNQDTTGKQLPGTIALPDGTKPLALGSGTITRLISAGGMAIVYEIWNSELEVKRAVKVLKPDHTQESEDRFHTEMKISAKLHHPNIVEIYTVGKWQDLPYIEMELIDGYTLENLVSQVGALPVEVCTAVVIMVGRALNYAHSQNYMLYGTGYRGVIHRDLKPGNIMVSKDGTVKLMDFGIAKPMTASIHTMDGVIMGTMQYLAPEQLDGKEIDARSDIYSLGVVLYEMLTGTQAFGEQNLAHLVTDKLANNYLPLTRYRVKIPSGLISLVHRCVRFEKDKRVQNVLEFLRTICRIHSMLTLKSPEQVMEQFIKTSLGEKRVVALRKRAPLVPAVKWSIAAKALAAAVAAALLYPVPRNLVREIPMRISAAASGARIPEDASSIVSRIDSILAMQKHATVINELLKPVKPAPERQIALDTKPAPQPAKSGRAAKKNKRLAEQKPQHAENNNAEVIAAAPQPLPDSIVPKAPPQQALGDDTQTLIEKLRKRLNTTDVFTMFCSEVEAEHFTNALQLYGVLSSDDATSKKAKIYRLRAMLGAGRAEDAKAMLLSNDIYDGEFYLEKSRCFFDMKDNVRAQEFIRRASATPSQYLDKGKYRELLLCSKALCASTLYDASPTAQAKKDAIEAWSSVKSLFGAAPEHDYYKKAEAEIRRINTSVAAK